MKVQTIAKHISIQVLLFGTLGIVYAAWNDTVSTGDPLTAASWNEVVDRVKAFTVSGGNVGIGTNTPASLLQVAGDMSLGTTSDTLYTNNIGIFSSSGDMNILYSAASLKFSSDYGEKIRFTRDGNVGIGTTTPKATLDVEGEIRATGFFIAYPVGGSNTATPAMCVNECSSHGGRMATVSELFAFTTGKNNICSYMWMVDDNNPGKFAHGFGMYSNRTTTGCGTVGTGNVPRLISLVTNLDYTNSTGRNCACYGIR